MWSTPVPCPHCGEGMIQGYLRGPLDTVYIESVRSLEGSPLQALIYPACGYVQLQAARPEDLARRDISNEELDAPSG